MRLFNDYNESISINENKYKQSKAFITFKDKDGLLYGLIDQFNEKYRTAIVTYQDGKITAVVYDYVLRPSSIVKQVKSGTYWQLPRDIYRSFKIRP